MIRFTIFPRLHILPGQKANPYIHDFVTSLEREGVSKVVNPPHKNPLLSLLPPKNWGDVFIFNWFESIPDFKYGPLQSVIAICFVLLLKFNRRKIIWILHNKKPHAGGHTRLKRFLTRFMAKKSDLILTHATEGVEMIRTHYPYATDKIHFLHHPTKNRLPESSNEMNPEYDLLIWGSISRYKGVLEYLTYLKENPQDLKICIIGKCSPASLADEIRCIAPKNVTFICESPSFEELARYIRHSAFVLAPYCPESVLSSGILMDSLSFGARVIGPDVGSFKDYACEKRLKVYTFHHYDEIGQIVAIHKTDPVSQESYRKFLEENDWKHFGDRIIELTKSIH